jgi:transcriptional regulator NrdR family protein
MSINQDVTICPKCGSKQTFVKTTRVREGLLCRRRGCRNCNHSYETVEIREDVYLYMRNMTGYTEEMVSKAAIQMIDINGKD